MLLVLLVMALVAVIGFAIGDLCVINLNLSRQYLASSRARLLAQAAVEQFMVTFDQACARARGNGLDLEAEVTDLGLRGLYQGGEGLPNRPYTGMPGTVSITFDSSRPYHSTDNSVSEYPKAGWADRGTANKSVPAFSVDLIINVDVDGAVRHYEAIVGRRWPFAVFAAQGVVVLSGTPIGTTASTDAVVTPSYVDGRVGTLQAASSNLWVALGPVAPTNVADATGEIRPSTGALRPDGTAAEDLSQRIADVVDIEEARFDADLSGGGLVAVGPPIKMVVRREPPPVVPTPDGGPTPDASPTRAPAALEVTDGGSTTTELPPASTPPLPGQPPAGHPSVPAPRPSPSPTLDPSTVVDLVPQVGNVLTGDVHVAEALRPFGENNTFRVDLVRAFRDNTFSGKINYGSWPAGLNEKTNPIRDVSFPGRLDQYKMLPALKLPKDPPELRILLEAADRARVGPDGQPLRDQGPAQHEDNSAKGFGFLFDTLTLDPDLSDDEEQLQFGGKNRFCYFGNLGNRFVKKEVTVKEESVPDGKGGMSTRRRATETFKLFETRGGIKLRNSILYIKGNLDLSARKTPGDEVGIEGSNSTLIVDGTLALSGGHLDSRDQGMVILARDVILRARGDYRGLIIATHSLSILPAANDGKQESMLNIRGGVFNGGQGGDTILRSVHIVYDPVYMKAVHNYGQALCTLFRDIP